MGHIDSGDTAFVLISGALVSLMTPGLAFFYGGLVRRKNVLAIMMQSFISMGIVTIIWVFGGYSLAFGHSIGGRHRRHLPVLRALRNMDGCCPATHIPLLAHFGYQEMFAIITPALITGAFADRVNFKAYLWFLVIWSILIYIPFCHWIWGGGFLDSWGEAWPILREASSSTSARASPPWPRSSWSASERSSQVRRPRRITSPSSRSAPACSGSVGSASTAAAPWARTAWPRRPS